MAGFTFGDKLFIIHLHGTSSFAGSMWFIPFFLLLVYLLVLWRLHIRQGILILVGWNILVVAFQRTLVTKRRARWKISPRLKNNGSQIPRKMGCTHDGRLLLEPYAGLSWQIPLSEVLQKDLLVCRMIGKFVS